MRIGTFTRLSLSKQIQSSARDWNGRMLSKGYKQISRPRHRLFRDHSNLLANRKQWHMIPNQKSFRCGREHRGQIPLLMNGLNLTKAIVADESIRTRNPCSVCARRMKMYVKSRRTCIQHPSNQRKCFIDVDDMIGRNWNFEKIKCKTQSSVSSANLDICICVFHMVAN